MKVICKCCHKSFDYDMYMGLCPKCGRVYRRDKGMYSVVEKDMVGDFHLHADDGGLNRGIQGVVYNQGSGESGKTRLNGFNQSTSLNQGTSNIHNEVSNNLYTTISPQATPKDAVETIKASTKNGYYAPTHKTKINQSVVKTKRTGNSLGVIIFLIIIIMSILSSIFD